MAVGKFRAEGNSIDYIPVADTAAGTVIQAGTNYVALVQNDISANAKGAAGIAGTFETTIALAGTYTQGNLLGFDLALQEAVPQGTGDFDLIITDTTVLGASVATPIRLQLHNGV